MNDTTGFNKIKVAILTTVAALFPLFFLPTTQEFFMTNKMYLLAVAALALFVTSVIQFSFTRTINWKSTKLDFPMLLFIASLIVTVWFISPNKVQGVLNPTYGLLTIVSLSFVAFYLMRLSEGAFKFVMNVFLASVTVASVISILFFFQPLKSVNLPVSLTVLRVPYFNTMGSALDLAVLVGFAIVLFAKHILTASKSHNARHSVTYAMLAINVVGLLLAVYTFVQPYFSNSQAIFPYPPYGLSWRAAVAVLNAPINLALGAGLDNFSAVFTQVRDAAYNASSQWQIEAFNVSRSAFLHVITESGLVAFGLLIFLLLNGWRELGHSKTTAMGKKGFALLAVVLGLAVLPPSLPLFFALFVALAGTVHHDRQAENETVYSMNFNSVLAGYFVLLVLGVVFTGASVYFLGRTYIAEYYYRQGLNAWATKHDLQTLYNDQVKAILFNPYVETYRIGFAQTNMFIANNIAAKASQNKDQKATLSDDDKNAITQRIQAAIEQAKVAINLNPQRAANYETLAAMYQNILTVAQGADAWTVSAYQRAIFYDPNNPVYQLALGGVYYSLNQYRAAETLFGKAASLKPDWSNAHYNLAWAAYQANDIELAVSEIQNTLSLLDPKKDANDYKKAQGDLDEFKKKLPSQDQTQATPSAQKQPSKLTLPSPPAATVEPRIQLPKEASPEAK